MSKPPLQENSLLWYSSLGVIITAATALIYGSVLAQPFVQDDWGVLYQLKTQSVLDVLSGAFDPAGKVLYRPLGTVYFLAAFQLFGINATPYHVVALIVHVANALLSSAVIEHLTGRRVFSGCLGMLYCIAAPVHGDTLLWIVGFLDIGTIALYLGSLLLYLRGRYIVSAIIFLCALLFKEAAAPLGFIIGLHALLFNRGKLKLLWPHGAVLGLYALVRLSFSQFQNMDASHPYTVGITGRHILDNLILFLTWAFEVILPFWRARDMVVIPVVALVVMVLLFVLVRRRVWPDRNIVRLSLFFGGWTLLGVLPVILLTHHLFRYYATYSLPPLLALFFIYAGEVLPRGFHRTAGFLLALYIAVILGTNWFLFGSRFRLEPASVPLYDGTNHLIRKASVVRTAQREMQNNLPDPPHHSHLVLSGIDVEPFGKQFGPRLWYDDTTLMVYVPAEFDSLNRLGLIDTEKTFFLTFSNDTLLH